MAKSKSRITAMDDLSASLVSEAAEAAAAVERDQVVMARETEIQAQRKAAVKAVDPALAAANAHNAEIAFVLDLLPLSAIQDRPDGDTRKLLPEQVLSLAGSIAEVDLINPISVEVVSDQEIYLLAGGHRRAALQLLALDPSQRPAFITDLKNASGKAYSAEDVDAFIAAAVALPIKTDLVPVRKYPRVGTKQADLRALKIEVAENEKRRNYTAGEIQAVAQKLESKGYKIWRGRPAKGEERKNLLPVMTSILGLHASSIYRALQKTEAAEAQAKSGVTETAVVIPPARKKAITVTTAEVLRFIAEVNSQTALAKVISAAKKRIAELDAATAPAAEGSEQT